MALVTLQRIAPVAPGAWNCRLCDAPINGSTQDNLLVGQPGTADVRAVICTRCGDALVRLVEVCGPQLNVLIKGENAMPATSGQTKTSELAATRNRLAREADTLGRAAQTLRGEAEKLTRMDSSQKSS
jgi:hypothetical protein